MKVLLVNTYYAPEMVGGAEHCVKKLAEQLLASGVQCAVLCTAPASEDAVVDGVTVFRRRLPKRDRVIDLAGASKPVRLIHELQNLYCQRNAKVIDEVLDQWKPDVIHTNGLYDLSPVVWRCAKKRGIPVVHTLHDYSLLCPRVRFMRTGETRECSNPYIWCRGYREVNRYCTRWVDLVTAPSDKTLSTLLRYGHFPNAKTQVVVNAIELDGHTQEILQRRIQKQKDTFTIAYLGELSEKKGLIWLLDAFAELSDPNLRLAIAGKGPLEETIRTAAQKDSRISYMGYLNEQQVGKLLDDSEVLTCPSLWQEPFGRVVIDAYKHAIPVISSDMGAFPEIVRDGVTGIIVPAGQKEALKQALTAYCDQRQAWLDACAMAAEEIKRFSMEEHIRAFTELYSQCIGRK